MKRKTLIGRKDGALPISRSLKIPPKTKAKRFHTHTHTHTHTNSNKTWKTSPRTNAIFFFFFLNSLSTEFTTDFIGSFSLLFVFRRRGNDRCFVFSIIILLLRPMNRNLRLVTTANNSVFIKQKKRATLITFHDLRKFRTALPDFLNGVL